MHNSREAVSTDALSGGSNLATTLSLNACPYLATSFFRYRPRVLDFIEATTILTQRASGTESAGSDIDLMVVGDAGFAEIVDATYAAQATLGREINPKVMSASEWQAKKAERNAFLQDVLNKPRIMLIGDADAL